MCRISLSFSSPFLLLLLPCKAKPKSLFRKKVGYREKQEAENAYNRKTPSEPQPTTLLCIFLISSLSSSSSLRLLIKSSRSFVGSLSYFFPLSISKFLGGSIRGCLRQALLALSSQRELESKAKVGAVVVVYRREGEENANRGKVHIQ